MTEILKCGVQNNGPELLESAEQSVGELPQGKGFRASDNEHSARK